MEEVTIKLAGGLGNYMFQIACAHAYALKNNKKPIFTIDDSIVIHKHLNAYKENILSNVVFLNNKDTKGFNIFNENGFHYNEIPNIEGNVYLNGYFQSEKYFKEYEKEIRDLFSYPKELPLDYEDSENSLSYKYKILNTFNNTCSIHVRRGDYLNSPNHHPTQNMNYYMKAIRQMPKDTVFFIFSDDIAWCKANFPDLPEKFKFVEGNTDYEDLRIMTCCKHNIICNSTFSWWAAWLNKNPDKKVIIPATWFGPAYANYNTDDLYCENWIKI
jgi:hypothetical protein